MRSIINTLLVVALPWGVTGQTRSSFDLLTERYVDRPIGMHKGQFQFHSGYNFSVINRKYDLQGERIDLESDGSVSANHTFPFILNYGILDFIQVSASINYSSMGIRAQNQVLDAGVGTISKREIQTYKGMDDLFLGLLLTDPFGASYVDLVLNAGISLPVFNHKPDQPSHRVEIEEPYPGSMDITYYYNNKICSGVQQTYLGGAFKLRSRVFSAAASFTFSSGFREGESISWQSRLTDGKISYREIPCQYDIGRSMDYQIILSWQAIDWFALLVLFEGYSNTGAWSTETGKKVLAGDVGLHTAGVGFDIQVAPALRLNQQILFPYNGKNVLAPRIFQTGISLNFLAPAGR